jgi:NADPH:quinone reductase-like Zn-dependent oxidoreductase
MVRQGAIDSPPKTPFILGFECAGEVAEIGEGVTDFKVSELLRVMVARLDLRTFVKHLLITEYFRVSGRQAGVL